MRRRGLPELFFSDRRVTYAVCMSAQNEINTARAARRKIVDYAPAVV
jgi:hypothetical protein